MYSFRTSADCACYECWLPPGASATVGAFLAFGLAGLRAAVGGFQSESPYPACPFTALLAGPRLLNIQRWKGNRGLRPVTGDSRSRKSFEAPQRMYARTSTDLVFDDVDSFQGSL